MSWNFNPFTGTLDRNQSTGSGGPATEAPKLIQLFNTDVLTAVGDLVRVNGSNSVTAISSNDASEIPNGIFGVVTNKPSAAQAEVIFVGIQGGYSGFTTGDALFIHTDGTLNHTAPATGMVQQVGFAVSTTEIFVFMQQALRRS